MATIHEEGFSKLVRLGDPNFKLNTARVADNKVCTYPSEWFANHPNELPSITFPSLTKDTLEYARQVAISEVLYGRKCEAEAVLAYFFHYMNTLSFRLDDNWESFGIKIGAKDEEITIWNLVKPRRIVSKKTQSSAPASEDDDIWLMGTLLGIYRYTMASNEEAKAEIWKKIKIHNEVNNGRMSVQVEIFLKCNYHMISDINFIKCVAAIDMFLNKSPRHVAQPLRIGTIPTRFRDCASLTSLNYFLNITGKPIEYFTRWLWTPQMAQEFARINKAGEEWHLQDSYVCYFMELAMASKSPYSTSTNPNIYFFIHCIGVALNNKRSRNAKLIGDISTNVLLLNAMMFIYVCFQRIEFVPQFYEEDQAAKYKESKERALKAIIEAERLEQESEDDESGSNGTGKRGIDLSNLMKPPSEPTTVDPYSWFCYLSDLNGKIPFKIRYMVCSQWAAEANNRKDTVGEFLYTYATAQLSTMQRFED